MTAGEASDRRLEDWTCGEPRLVIERCDVCRHHWYLPRLWCPRCWSEKVHRSASSGQGTLIGVSTVRRAPTEDEGEPFGICLVELDEQVRVLGRCPSWAPPGSRVHVSFAGASTVPYFTPE